MTFRKALIVVFLPALLWGQGLLQRSMDYDITDWVTYPSGRYITCMTQSTDRLFVGTTAGVLVWNIMRESWEQPYTVSSGMIDDRVKAIHWDNGTSTLWVWGESGISRLEPAAQDFYVENLHYLLDGPVEGAGQGRQHCWIVTERSAFSSSNIEGPYFRSSMADLRQDDVHWFGRDNGDKQLPELFVDGDYFYDPDRRLLQDNQLRRYSITVTHANAFQEMWMGVWGLGLAVADLRMQDVSIHQYGPWADVVRALAWSETGLWMGGQSGPGRSGAITHWDWDDGSWQSYEAAVVSGLNSDHVSAIDGAGRYTWFGTDTGLSQIDEETMEWRSWTGRSNLWSEQINHLTVGEQGLWIATESGLNLMDINSSTISRVGHSDMKHRRIWKVEALGADCWAGTDRGLFYYNAEQNQWTYIDRPAGISYLYVTALSALGNELWVGTDDGVMKQDLQTGLWETFPANYIPRSGAIFTILADEAYVWFGTESGLLRYTRDENRWRMFTVEDGLPDMRVFDILADGDYLWLATGRGVTRFRWRSAMRID